MEKQHKSSKKITLAFCLLCTMAFAQVDRPKVAVYVSDQSGYSDDVKNALRIATMNVLVMGGKYEVVERSSVIDEELSKQASGSVDDDQMVAFGRQAGAKYICVSDIIGFKRYYVNPVYSEATQNSPRQLIREGYHVHIHQVSARIIDVETAQLVGLGVIEADVQSGPQMSAAITNAVQKMLGTLQTVTNPNLPKKALYVQGGGRSNSYANALYTFALDALFVRSRDNGDFIVVERNEAFAGQIDREQGKQRSGSVADSEISRMGKQYGIEEIVIASIEPVMGTYNINARLVNVERSSVVNASQLRHFNPDNEKGAPEELRLTAVRMVQDMIPKQITQADIEHDKREEERMKAEAERMMEGERTASMAAFMIGGGMALDMAQISPDYYSSWGGNFYVAGEFYNRHTRYFRYGVFAEIGGVGDVDKDMAMKNYPNNYRDSITSISFRVGALVKLYPFKDLLYITGGAGFGSYSTWSQQPKASNIYETEEVDIVNVKTPIFPVGGGIAIGESGIFVEGLYTIVPFQGRTAKYLSVNFGIKGAMRTNPERQTVKQVRKEI